MLDPKVYEVLERAVRSFARLFPKGDVPKISAIAIICTTAVLITLISSKAIDFAKTSGLYVLAGWATSTIIIVWLCRRPVQERERSARSDLQVGR